MRAGRNARPRLVLLDPEHWDAFESLGPAVRSRGLDVVRLIPSGDQSPPARLRDRLMYGGASGRLPQLEDAATLRRWTCPPTVDVQGPDELVQGWRAAGSWPWHEAARRVPDATRAELLHDKYLMGQFAERLGIAVPRMWRRLPDGVFPIVVKRASGSGGKQVRVVRDASALQQALHEVDVEGRGGVFFQELVPGPCETFGGVVDRGRLLAGATYRIFPREGDPLGPAERLRITDSDEIWEQSKALCHALGYTGFICIDYIAPVAGRASLIDVNPRVFGSWLALQELGVDLLAAYLSLFGLGQPPDVVRGASVGDVRMIRHVPLAEASTWMEWASEARSSARSVVGAARVVGWRYLVVGGVRSGARLSRSASRLARRRRGSGSPPH